MFKQLPTFISRVAPPHRLFSFGPRDVVAPVMGWVLYLLALTCYCLVYKQVLLSSPVNWAVAWDTLGWACREWGAWLILTPVALRFLRRYSDASDKSIEPWLGVAMLLVVALVIRISLDLMAETGDEIASLVILFPRYLLASLVVLLVWRFYLCPKVARRASTTPDAGEVAAPEQCPESILVNKGSGQTLLPIEQIQWLSASGNYVEVHCGEASYLVRSTMQQLQRKLPADSFLRIHRSYIVNREAISQITGRSSGGGEVLLKNGQTLALSKKYRRELQQFKLQ